VKEQVFPTTVVNESETLVGQSLDCAFCHRVTLLLLRLESGPHTLSRRDSGGGIFDMANIAMCIVLRGDGETRPGRSLRTSFQLVVGLTLLFLFTLAFGEGVLVLVAGDGSAP
jgi:hypothetical protein